MKIGAIGFNNSFNNSVTFQKKISLNKELKENKIQSNKDAEINNKQIAEALCKVAYLGALTACLTVAAAGCKQREGQNVPKQPVQQQQYQREILIQIDNDENADKINNEDSLNQRPLFNTADLQIVHDKDGNITHSNIPGLGEDLNKTKNADDNNNNNDDDNTI